MFSCTVTVTTDPVVLWTLNEVEDGPTASVDVLNVNVSVPLFTPLVGDTVTQALVDCTTDHLSAPFPGLLTRTVWDGALVPVFPCTLTVVGLTESTACAPAGRGRKIATKSRRNRADRAH